MSNQLIASNDLIFEPENLTKDTIKKYLCPLASDQELLMGLQIAKTFKLNPLKREVYFVKYGNNPMQVLTGYEVYLKRAERSGKWNGMEISSEGSVKNGDLKAIVKVYRKDWEHPLVHEAYYAEYVQTKQDGTPNKFWATKPITMIKKVTVSQAFRMAYPEEFDGMPYTSDEVIDQEKVIDITETPRKPVEMPEALDKPNVQVDKESSPEVIQDSKKTVSQEPLQRLLSKKEEDELIKVASAKGFTAKTFKEWLNFVMEIPSRKEITIAQLPEVLSKLNEIKEVKEVSK